MKESKLKRLSRRSFTLPTYLKCYLIFRQVYHKHWLDSPWSGFFEGKDPLKMADTGVHEETLTHIGKRFGAGPPNAQDFIIHKAMTRILNVSTFQYFVFELPNWP